MYKHSLNIAQCDMCMYMSGVIYEEQAAYIRDSVRTPTTDMDPSNEVQKSKLSLIKSRKKRSTESSRSSESNNQITTDTSVDSEGQKSDQSVFKAMEGNHDSKSGEIPVMSDDTPSSSTSAVKEATATGLPKSAPISSNTSRPAAPKYVIKWTCGECNNSCIPVRSESRCLCGHRYKEHKASTGSSPENIKFSCSSKNCAFAEGAWILRCRCKHKHIDHDCGTKPFLCKKNKCPCVGFDSPWVCNCGHPWASHKQSVEESAGGDLLSRMMALNALEGSEVNEEVAADMLNVMSSNAMSDLDMMRRNDGDFK